MGSVTWGSVTWGSVTWSESTDKTISVRLHQSPKKIIRRRIDVPPYLPRRIVSDNPMLHLSEVILKLHGAVRSEAKTMVMQLTVTTP